MNTNHSSIDTELLINYAHGMLDPEVAARIKQQLQEDEFLRGQYEGIVYLMQTYPDQDPADVMKTMMAELDNQLQPEPVKMKQTVFPIRRWKPFAIAASVILLLGTGLFMWQSRSADPVRIAGDLVVQEYHNPVADEDVDRGGADTSWYANFSEGNYARTIQRLSALPDSVLSGREEFFYGLSFLKSSPQQLGRAESHLQKSAALQGSYQQDALYYLGIIQLLKKDVEAAKKYLSRANTPQAKDLLERLPR